MSFESLSGELQRLVFAKLDAVSLCRLGACNSQLWGETIAHRGWQYYPFHLLSARAWKEFYETVWRTRDVQRVLYRKMKAWDARYAMGDDLWSYTRSSIWEESINQKVDDYLQDSPAYHDWLLEYKEYLPELEDDDDVLIEAWFDSYEYAVIRSQFVPAQESYEAQILYAGANQLADVFLAVAMRMFPDGGACLVRSTSLWRVQLENQKRNNPHITDWEEEESEDCAHLTVVVPKHKLIVDLVRNHCYQGQDERDESEELAPASLARHFNLP